MNIEFVEGAGCYVTRHTAVLLRLLFEHLPTHTTMKIIREFKLNRLLAMERARLDLAFNRRAVYEEVENKARAVCAA